MCKSYSILIVYYSNLILYSVILLYITNDVMSRIYTFGSSLLAKLATTVNLYRSCQNIGRRKYPGGAEVIPRILTLGWGVGLISSSGRAPTLGRPYPVRHRIDFFLTPRWAKICLGRRTWGTTIIGESSESSELSNNDHFCSF